MTHYSVKTGRSGREQLHIEETTDRKGPSRRRVVSSPHQGVVNRPLGRRWRFRGLTLTPSMTVVRERSRRAYSRSRQSSTATSSTGSGIGGSGLAILIHT